MTRADVQDRMAERARQLAETLVGWPSVTGTPDEAAFPRRLEALLRTMPHFQHRPEDVIIAPIAGDPGGRSNLFALVRGRGAATVVLTGHFDVVPDDDYGDLATLARTPEALRTGLVERLERTGSHPQALGDLISGAFVPGRGMLDMKSGLAAGLAALEAFAADHADGNLLLLATPDEEDSSAGMRAAAALLPTFLRERGLEPRLAINLDATCDSRDGETGRLVALGCLGKLLLSAFVVGVESHAAYPFAGVNAAYLAAELAIELECSPDLGEVTEGEVAAPPTLLGFKDGKSLYNVTVPGDAWLFWNVLLHRRTAAAVLEVARRCAQEAAERAGERVRRRAAAIGHGNEATEAWGRLSVLTFAELLGTARQARADFEAGFAAEATRLAQASDIDLPSRNHALTRFAWKASGLEGPAIILGFASMPYPPVEWARAGGALEATIERAVAETERALDARIALRRFYPAIADMSFVGPVDPENLRRVAANTPAWGTSIPWDLDGSLLAGVPIVNAGPWGRDYHHWLERVHADYAFRVLPRLVLNIVRGALAPGEAAP